MSTLPPDSSGLLVSKRLVLHPLFKDWTLTEVMALMGQSQVRHYKVGALIAMRGKQLRGFHYIEEGGVELRLSLGEGQSKLIKTLKAGDTVGDTYMLMNCPYRLDVIATEAVQTRYIEKRQFFECLFKKPELMLLLMEQLSQRLHHLLGDTLGSVPLSGTQRVILYLLGDLPLANGSVCVLTQAKSQIAASLSLTPEHFSRILHGLSRKGFIKVQARQITILDIAGLCLYDR